MKNFKSILCLILTVNLALTFFPGFTFAENTSSDGDENNIAIISDNPETFGPGFEDPMHTSDEEFFGLWDSERANWDEKHPGKINYSASDKLSSMEQYVKSGDYESAKAEWLSYLRGRTDQLNGGTTSDYKKADLWCENIFVLNTYVNEFTVTNLKATVSCDVTDAFSSSKKLSLILMSKYMDEAEVVFSSREGEASPRLIIRAGDSDYTFYPQKDAYVKACNNKANNYGTEQYLIVDEAYDNGTGEGKNTWSSDTSRAYLCFNLEGLDSNAQIQSAILELYGSTSGKSAQILVLSDTDTSWSETGITWANILPSDTLWQKNGYVEWNAFPDITSGMSSEGKFNIARSYYLNTLAGVYKSTGNEYYAYHGIRHMMQFIRQTGSTIATYSNLDAGIRARQMTLAFSALIHSASMTPEECSAISKYLYSLGEFLSSDSNFRKDHNHGGFQNNGFARIVMFFPEFKTYSAWLELANSRYTILLQNVICEDGSYREASSSYASALISNVYAGLEFMKSFGYTLSDEGRDLLAKGSRYLCDISYPNMISFPYGQASSASIVNEIRTYAGYLGDDELLYIITNGKEGTKPQNGPSVSYPGNHKWGIMKSSWNSDARALYINNGGGNGLSHTQLDNLAIVAYGYGSELLPDSGCFNYDGTEAALWLDSTEAHSTIMIDGLEQSKKQIGTIDKWVTNKGFDFYQGTGQLTPSLSNTHSRNVLFVKPGFWIVSDSLKGTGTHTYEQNWHFLCGQTPEVDPVTKSARSTFENQANIQVVPVDPENLSASLKDGYQCSVKDAMEHTKFLKYTKKETGNTCYDTVLFPVEAGSKAQADVRRINMNVTPDVATAFEVCITDDSGEEKGVYYLSHEDSFSNRNFDDYSFDGKCSYISYDNSGNLKDFYVIDGSELVHEDTVLFDAKGSKVNDLSVAYKNTAIVLESQKLTADDLENISLYSNGTAISKVIFNGTSVNFVQEGNLICFDGTESDKTEGWYFIESFDDMSFSLGQGCDIAFDPTSDASTSGWNAYYKNSKGTLYGSVTSACEKNNPYDKYLTLNRSKSSTTNATVYTGYYDVNGYADDEFIVDLDIRIAPSDNESSGGYFRNTVALSGEYGWGSPSAYIVFTTDVVDNSGKRINVVKYYDTATGTEIEIPELRNFKTGKWHSIRFVINNVTNTYDLYVEDGKDAGFGTAVRYGIGFDDTTIKEVYVSALRNAFDANGLYGGGAICLDNLRIGAETTQDNLYRIGKAEERIDFEDVALNSSLADTPDASLGWDFLTRSSRKVYGSASIVADGTNQAMRLYMTGNTNAEIYASYPISDGLSSPDGKTTVQLRYKSMVSDISNQNDKIRLYTASSVADGLKDYGVHVIFYKGNVYVADENGASPGGTEPPVTLVEASEKIVPGKWYTVKIVVDFDTMTYDLYFSDSEADGGKTPVASAIKLYKQDDANYIPGESRSIKRVHFSTLYNTSDSNLNVKSDFCIDDLIFNPDLSADLYDSIYIDSSLMADGIINIKVPLNLITYNSAFVPEHISHRLVVAVYSEGNLLKAVDVATGSFSGKEIFKTVTFDPEVFEDSTVKVFLIDGLNSIHPLGSFEIIS